MLTCSPVFADMLSLPTLDSQKEVYLTNGTFETAETIRLFLEVVSPTLADVEELLLSSWRTLSKDLYRLVLFLDKYNSEVGVRMLRLYGSDILLRQHDNVPSCDRLLVYASVTNDLGLCTRIIKKVPLKCGERWTKRILSGLSPTLPSRLLRERLSRLLLHCRSHISGHWVELRCSQV